MRVLVRVWLYSIAILPFPLLYLLSDLLFFIAFYLLKYRRNVVESNLRNAFPEYSEEQIQRISKQFFHDLSDLVLETIKILTISQKTLLKRCVIADTDGSRHYFSQKKGAVILTAHFGNWEWAGHAIGMHTKDRPVQVIYLRLRNEIFNDLMRRIRTRFGNSVVHMEMALRQIMQRKQEGIVSCFLADQTPQPHQVGLWTTFFHQMTGFFTGPEKIAARLDQNVYFGNIIKTRRGYYRIEMTLITDQPQRTAPGWITETYARLLESAIRQQPSTWLWSHRRWKHKWPGRVEQSVA